MRYIFSQNFQKHGLITHFNEENWDKTLFFQNGDWYIVVNLGIGFYNNIKSQLAIKLMNFDETEMKED